MPGVQQCSENLGTEENIGKAPRRAGNFRQKIIVRIFEDCTAFHKFFFCRSFATQTDNELNVLRNSNPGLCFDDIK
ncbi:hypothetical protein V1477_004382 [Vespula maculifrons]|uniref:Uncharacterized protein n=1 Tax=Vespula maculifrons TaxID=7453 RepID=A0ABD2CRG4_VESMC